MELKYTLVLISLIGIFLLYVLSSFSQPETISLEDLEQHEGKKITVTGIVLTNQFTSYGNQIIEIIDNKANGSGFKATVFSQKEASVEYGDYIQVIGTVQQYNGAWEIVTDNEHAIRVLQKWQNTSFPIQQLSQYPERYIGIHVNVTGIIEQKSDTNYYLNDHGGKYSLLIRINPPLIESVIPGELVSVKSTFTYDEQNLRYVLDTKNEPNPIAVIAEE